MDLLNKSRKIVIDSNRVIAALLKDGTTRNILFDKKFKFMAPEFLISEVNKYKKYILDKLNVKDEDFDSLFNFVFENIIIISETEYHKFFDELKSFIDQKDLPYIAVCLATKAEGIWTHDPHFKEQDKVRVFTNIDLIKRGEE